VKEELQVVVTQFHLGERRLRVLKLELTSARIT
jgi:hypothetical protein